MIGFHKLSVILINLLGHLCHSLKSLFKSFLSFCKILINFLQTVILRQQFILMSFQIFIKLSPKILLDIIQMSKRIILHCFDRVFDFHVRVVNFFNFDGFWALKGHQIGRVKQFSFLNSLFFLIWFLKLYFQAHQSNLVVGFLEGLLERLLRFWFDLVFEHHDGVTIFLFS